MKTMKRALIATMFAAALLIGPAGFAGTAHAEPFRPVEAGSTAGGTFNDSVCNRFAKTINDHIGDSFRSQMVGDAKAAKKSMNDARSTQDQAMDAGCFVVNPV